MSNQPQTVAKTDEQAKPVSEDNSALDDLDTLLSEYDDQNNPVEQSDGIDEKVDLKEVVSYYKKDKEEKEAKQTKDDIDSAINTIKNGLDVNLPDWAVRGKLETMAQDDPRVARAWANRRQDSTTWNKILDRVRSDIISEMAEKPDKDLTETRESLASVVQSASTKNAPDGDDLPDLKTMSDTEFAIWKSKLK